MNTYNDNLQTLTSDMPELRYPLRKRISAELINEQVERKTKRDDMLSALTIDDVEHEHSEELAKLVNEEYKVAMMEISSGNGKARETWDYANECYSEHITAQATDDTVRNVSGLSEELVDSNDGEIKQKDVVIGYDREQDCFFETTMSNYSLWDTIALNGAQIVRLNEQWRKGFRKDKWVSYSNMRLTKKHNALMGNNRKREDVVLSTYDVRKAKRLAKLQARMGGNTDKIGFNAYQK